MRRDDRIAIGLLFLIGVGVCGICALLEVLEVMADKVVRP
jgi:hypothetical protein